MDGLPETRDAQLKQDLKKHIEVFTLADRLGISHLLTETASDILDIVCYLGLGIFRDTALSMFPKSIESRRLFEDGAMKL